jgi:predicted Zn-dependent protease
MVGARRALLQLVRAKDDVAEYWAELGKVQASMGSYSDAYYAFTRAYELDRSNPALLRAVTELALRSGDLGLAESHARELEIVAPGDPWVKLTDGWAAVSQSHYDKALTLSDEILRSTPFDPAGTVLKARALMGLERDVEAEDLLLKQVQSQPSDGGSLQLLAKMYVARRDWPKAAEAARRLAVLAPNDRENSLRLIDAALRAGNVPLGRAASARVLKPAAEPDLIAAVLALWSNHWNSPQRLQDAATLASRAAGLDQKLAYAAFLSREGDPAGAVRLSSEAATFPVNARNAEANAVLGDAWWRLGKRAEGKNRLDAVLAFDPGNATALRGRAELALKTGNAAAAVIDAQKLVTVLPNSADDRLLLARCFAAAGNARWADRTLWSAFQEIPANDVIYAALAATRKGNSEATRELNEEFARQRDAKLSRGLI